MLSEADLDIGEIEVFHQFHISLLIDVVMNSTIHQMF